MLAFLCNELNCSKNITSEIERSLDHMGDIRRDKWMVEGKLRRYVTFIILHAVLLKEES